MTAISGALLPYDPQYVGHREAEKRRQETREWLRHQELKLSNANESKQSPSVVPEQRFEHDTG